MQLQSESREPFTERGFMHSHGLEKFAMVGGNHRELPWREVVARQ